MDNNYLFIERSNGLNNVIAKKFNSMQRIKPKSFDVSSNYIIFGASSGGIYILKRDPCEFLKIIPTKGGSADIIAISDDERCLSIATSQGLIIIITNFKDSNVEYQIFDHHADIIITAMKWHKNLLCTGDESGKVSLATISPGLTKTIFQVPSEHVLKLDSSIVQIDAYNNYLLISSTTRACLCNTDEQFYVQIGKKMRNGEFGACFCDTSQLEAYEPSIFYEEECKIYCARPGLRLWQASFDCKVMMTYQFKEDFDLKPTDVMVIGNKKKDILQEREKLENDKIDQGLQFKKIFSICGRFIVTHYAKGLYVFDLITSKLRFSLCFPDDVRDITILNSTIYVWLNNLELSVFSLIKLENLVLQTLYNEQYTMCSEICIKYCDNLLEIISDVKDLYLINVLKTKLTNNTLLDKLDPIFKKIDDINNDIINSNKSNDVIEKEEQTETNIEDNINNFKVLHKQYIVNKTYKNLNVPETHEMLDRLDADELLALLKGFVEYVSKEMNDNVTEWCQELLLQQINKRHLLCGDLSDSCLDYLYTSVININKNLKYYCACKRPLPICHQFQPKYYGIAIDLLTHKSYMDKVISEIPYLSLFLIKSEMDKIDLSLLVQYNDPKIIKEYSKYLAYDKWYDVLWYFIKLNKGLCLNCNAKINIEGLMTWTEMGKILLQLLGATNAIRILKHFEKDIPQGTLDTRFYQACIVTEVFKGIDGDVKADYKTAVEYVDGLQGDLYNNFQKSLESYFNRKNRSEKSFQSSVMWLNSNRKCPICKLPLKNDLYGCKTNSICHHEFHEFCLKSNNAVCTLCSDKR